MAIRKAHFPSHLRFVHSNGRRARFIVIDDDSDDDTVEEAAELKQPTNVRSRFVDDEAEVVDLCDSSEDVDMEDDGDDDEVEEEKVIVKEEKIVVKEEQHSDDEKVEAFAQPYAKKEIESRKKKSDDIEAKFDDRLTSIKELGLEGSASVMGIVARVEHPKLIPFGRWTAQRDVRS